MNGKELIEKIDKDLNEVFDVKNIVGFHFDLLQKAYSKGLMAGLKVGEKYHSKAKELLNEFMRISKASDEDFEHDYSELIGDTEQFLNGDGCPDILCEDCTKEDCTVRKLGLVEK